jgi:hypothetical protein
MRRRVGAVVPMSVKSTIRIAHWKARGRPDPPPAHLKHRALRAAGERYSLRTFVETGTFHGDTLAALRKDFDDLTSIELGDQLHEEAERRFAGDPKVTVLKGDSRVVLPEVAARISTPTLFWLDAHYSGQWHPDFEETAGADRPMPIFEELEAVLADPRHVIYIDDARLFNGEYEQWPTVPQISDFVAGQAPQRAVAVVDDIIRVLPGSAAAA